MKTPIYKLYLQQWCSNWAKILYIILLRHSISRNSNIALSLPLWGWLFDSQGGRGHLSVNYTSPHSFLITFSNSMAKQPRGTFLEFWWVGSFNAQTFHPLTYRRGNFCSLSFVVYINFSNIVIFLNELRLL